MRGPPLREFSAPPSGGGMAKSALDTRSPRQPPKILGNLQEGGTLRLWYNDPMRIAVKGDFKACMAAVGIVCAGCVLACRAASPAVSSLRPYEMEWAGRTADDRPPLCALVDTAAVSDPDCRRVRCDFMLGVRQQRVRTRPHDAARDDRREVHRRGSYQRGTGPTAPRQTVQMTSRGLKTG